MLLACLLAFPSWTRAQTGPQRLPNVVILYADDMGYGDLAIQNPDSKIPTPNLDKLATQGMRFTDAHSSSGICTPSRYALLTGRHHWRDFHEIVNSFDPPVFKAGQLTVAEMLRQKGYQTACIGKWHLGWDWQAIMKPGAQPSGKAGYLPSAFDWSKPIPGGPLDRGFDYYFGDDVPNFPPYTWFENDKVAIVPTESLTVTAKTAEGSWEARPGPAVKDWDFYGVMPKLTTKAVEWLDQRKGSDKPFFLYFPFTSPHAPIVPTPEFVGKSKAGGFGDFVVQTDWTVGQVLQTLEKNGMADNTIVIFSADNGPERYAYDRVKNFQHRSSGPLRGLKRDLWEGGHRVPFVVRWPGVVPAGKVSDAMLSQVDIMATVASVVGAKLPDASAEDSYDQLAVWKGEQTESPRRTIIHNTAKDGYAIRDGNWLLVDAKTGAVSAVPPWFAEQEGFKKNDQPGELYDLSQDLGQRKNLYADNPEKVTELKALMNKIRTQGHSAPRLEK